MATPGAHLSGELHLPLVIGSDRWNVEALRILPKPEELPGLPESELAQFF
jgi:hypothetical protein